MELKTLSNDELLRYINKEFNRRKLIYFSCDLCYKIELGERDDNLAHSRHESFACCESCAERCRGCNELVCRYNIGKHEDCITEEIFKEELKEKVEVCCCDEELLELAEKTHSSHLNEIINRYIIVNNYSEFKIKPFVLKCKFDVNTEYKWYSSLGCDTILLFSAIEFFCFNMINELLELNSNTNYVNSKGYNIIDVIFLAQYNKYDGNRGKYYTYAEQLLKLVERYDFPRTIHQIAYKNCENLMKQSEYITNFIEKYQIKMR